jgi:hypothetical protein
MNNIVKKCFKSYLTGKKYIDDDIDKSYDYFKQCINIIETIKNKNIEIDDSIIDIIDETEKECNKYLISSLECLIDKPYYINNTYDYNELFNIIGPNAVISKKDNLLSLFINNKMKSLTYLEKYFKELRISKSQFEIIIISEIPKLSNGKINYFELEQHIKI